MSTAFDDDDDDAHVLIDTLAAAKTVTQLKPPTLQPRRVAYCATAVYCSHLLSLGMIIALLGPSLPELRRRTGVSEATISYLFAARALGYVFGSLAGGRLLDVRRWNSHYVVFVALSACALFTAIVPVLSSVAPYGVLLVPLFAAGMCGGTIDTSGNIMIIRVWLADVDPWMQLVHAFFGAGALAAPLFIAVSRALGLGLEGGLWAMALLMVGTALPTLFVPEPPKEEAHAEDSAQSTEASVAIRGLRRSLVWLLATYLFIYVGAEIAFGGWITTYAMLRGMDESTADLLNSAFWASLTAGRLLGMPISVYLRPTTILIVDMLGALLSVLVLSVFQSSIPLLWICVMVAGCCMGSVWPSAVSLPSSMMGMPLSGTETGFLVVGAALGEMVIPIVIGLLLQHMGAESMPYVLVVLFLIAVVFYGAILFVMKAIQKIKGPKLTELSLVINDSDETEDQELPSGFEHEPTEAAMTNGEEEGQR